MSSIAPEPDISADLTPARVASDTITRSYSEGLFGLHIHRLLLQLHEHGAYKHIHAYASTESQRDLVFTKRFILFTSSQKTYGQNMRNAYNAFELTPCLNLLKVYT